MSDDALRGELWRRGAYRALVPGVDPDATSGALSRLGGDPRVHFAAAIHPWEVVDPEEPSASPLDARFERLMALASRSDVAAIGETGLDALRFPSGRDRDAVEQAFLRHLEIAREVRKPIIVHCVRAHNRCIELLSRFRDPSRRGVVHAFGGSAEEARQYARLGLVIGIGAAVSRPQSRRVRAVAASIAADGYLVETDAPFMAADGRAAWSGRVDDLTRVIEEIAALRSVSPEAVAEASARAFDLLLSP